MIAEEDNQQPHFHTQDTPHDHNPHQTAPETCIEPWNMDPKLTSRTQLSSRHGRLQTHSSNSQRKKSVDEKIGEIYRKYSNQGGLGENAQPSLLSSRQIYREKLKQFDNGLEFRRMGSHRQAHTEQLSDNDPPQLSFRRANLYCCDYKEFSITSPVHAKPKQEYRVNDKFQRMLKIRDKIRKKNSLAVSRQKQKYLNQYEPEAIYQQKETTYVAMAKATVQRNKLKLKLRGLSRQDITRKNDLYVQPNRTTSFSARPKHPSTHPTNTHPTNTHPTSTHPNTHIDMAKTHINDSQMSNSQTNNSQANNSQMVSSSMSNEGMKGGRAGLSVIFQKLKFPDGQGWAQKMNQTLPYFKR